MNLSRLDLDGFGAPSAIAERIHELQSDLPPGFSIDKLCHALDILEIQQTNTTAYEAALVIEGNKASGGILLASGRSAKRQRFSIAHELGHFLIPSHMPSLGERFSCSCDDLRLSDTRERDRRRRIEAEANGFAAHLLMPRKQIRARLSANQPDLGEVMRLAREFEVSKEAMARSYIDAHRETLATVVLLNGRIDRIYRSDHFPWLEPKTGQPVPEGSMASGHRLMAGELTQMEECEPEAWFSESNARRIECVSEQVLGQAQGFTMILLHAELAEEF